MTLGTLLQAILALFFIYSALALFASEIQEYISAGFESRAKRLKESIRQMLGEKNHLSNHLSIIDNNTVYFYNKKEEPQKIYIVKNKDMVFPKETQNFPKKTHQYIWIKDSENQEVDDTNVECLPNNESKGKLKNETKDSVTKYKVELLENDSYYIDIINKAIFKINNPETIEKTKISNLRVDSLTEKFYKHPNIKALNQSGFAWLSLRKFFKKNLVVSVCFILLIISLIGGLFLLFSDLQNKSLLVVLGLIGLVGLIILLIWGRNRRKKEYVLGTNRKSVGPSYIDDELFAITLEDVINENATQETQNDTKKILNFDTPAQSVLDRWYREIETNDKYPNLKTLLIDKYKQVQERSSGVYKRNATGLSFLIGFLIAILLNADTFHMVSNLTNENNNIAENITKDLESKSEIFTDQEGEDNSFTPKQQEQIRQIFNSIETLPFGWGTVDDRTTADLKKIQSLNNIIKTFNFGYLDTEIFGNSQNDTNNKSCNLDHHLLQIEEVKNAKQKLDEAQKNERKNLQDAYNEAKENAKTEAEENRNKKCFQAMENKLIELTEINKSTGDNNTDNLELVYNLSPELKQAIRNVGNKEIDPNNGEDTENSGEKTDPKSDFWDKYKAFMDTKNTERLNLILSLDNEALKDRIGTQLKKQGGLPKVIIGWIITAIAISMGAPFWFDLLGRLINVRTTKKNKKLDN